MKASILCFCYAKIDNDFMIILIDLNHVILYKILKLLLCYYRSDEIRSLCE